MFDLDEFMDAMDIVLGPTSDAVIGVTHDDRIVLDDSKIPEGCEIPEAAVVARLLDPENVEKEVEGMVVLSDLDYDGIIGTVDGRVLYSYDKLIEAFVKHNEDWTEEDAIEWIDYNTIRSLPYQPGAPVIMFNLE